MKDKIIGFIRDNKLSTADVADALGRKGHVKGLSPLNRGFYRVGEVHYLYAWWESIWETHKDLAQVPPQKILYFDNLFCGEKSILGHLMTEYAMSHKNSLALVVNGNIRDIDRMANYAIWCRGHSPIICEKRQLQLDHVAISKARDTAHGGVMVCDDTGVVIIEPARVNQDTYQKLVKVSEREREWYEKLADGMSTFDITCQPE